MQRLLVFLAGVVGALGVAMVPVAAQADPYPPTTPTADVSSGTVAEDGSVTFSGHATPFEVMTITVTYGTGGTGGGTGVIVSNAAHGTGAVVEAGATATGGFVPARMPAATTVTVGTVTADASGDWSIVVHLTQSGTATLTATGPISGSVSQTVTVVAASSSSTLARTGQDGAALRRIVLWGAGALLLGTVLILGAGLWRRRAAGNTAG
jgi:hypothetical protein